MFLIDAPFVSQYLKKTLQDLNITVIQTAYAEKVLAGYKINYISELEAINAFSTDRTIQFFTN